ncbi:hypothetical protein GCWU000341_02811 [Oribacterium sp. oral taxon 078 str. F0262]|nr:hypothetical protein GCWU000341_02811 [Oribacterium sp. oral taxon 078 str. F0262]
MDSSNIRIPCRKRIDGINLNQILSRNKLISLILFFQQWITALMAWRLPGKSASEKEERHENYRDTARDHIGTAAAPF